MSKRIEAARICHEGASNERRVAQALVDAIDECRAEGVNPLQDDATFVILNQVVHLLANESLSFARYCGATNRLGLK